VAYTTVINACAAADRTDLAIRLLDEMAEERGLAPNAAACFAVARACRRAGQWERALVLVDDMEARGVPPVSAILECVAAACLTAGRRDHALALLQRMRLRGLGAPEGLYAKVR
jgi:pentatricopeptide repeat protein